MAYKKFLSQFRQSVIASLAQPKRERITFLSVEVRWRSLSYLRAKIGLNEPPRGIWNVLVAKAPISVISDGRRQGIVIRMSTTRDTKHITRGTKPLRS